MDLIELHDRLAQSRIRYKQDLLWRDWLDAQAGVPKYSIHKTYLAIQRWLSGVIMSGATQPLKL